MKIIALLAVAACTFGAEPVKHDVDAYVFGLSKHTNKNIDYNETNAGLALGIAWRREEGPDVTLIAGTYKDSYNDMARFVMVGPRKVWGDREALHATLGLSGGYFVGSGWHGVGFMPSASVGYDRFDLCMTGSPYFGKSVEARDGNRDPQNNKGIPTSFVAVFLKIRLASF